MKLKNKFLSSALLLPLATAGLMVSCEDTCVNCNCESYSVSYVSSPDSIDSSLGELYSDQTIVIKGTGLSSTKEVFLIDSAGTPYYLTLNPAFVSDKNIIITLDNEQSRFVDTENIVLVSGNGCKITHSISKPVAAPAIKMFYSEFVADLDTMRVFGSGFLDNSEGGDTLKVWFQEVDENGQLKEGKTYPISSYKIKNSNEELLFAVPAGLPNNLKLCAKNSHGFAVSNVMFRDTRNVWLDFDNYSCGEGTTGAFEIGTYNWNPKEDISGNHSGIMERIGKLPKECSGKYQALTNMSDYKANSYLYLTPMSSFPDSARRNLLGQWEGVEDIQKMVLKFEVYIPEELPWYSHAYIVFSAYGTEDEGGPYCEEAYGFDPFWGGKKLEYLSRSLTSNEIKVPSVMDKDDLGLITCKSTFGVPGAWFHMGTYKVNADGTRDASAEIGGFSTKHGWMTVAVPLTYGDGNNFNFAIADKGIFTQEKAGKKCGMLEQKDFYNFFFHFGGEDAMQTNGAKALSSSDHSCFIAFDNFRIVPDDGGGSRFSTYSGAIPGSSYPY